MADPFAVCSIVHNKLMVIDGSRAHGAVSILLKAAESSNAKNLLVLGDPQVAAKYLKNWQVHAAHSEGY
ncbi:MAG: putative endonuclease precursor with phospholipase D-like domain [Verrucomicrobiales bacterium]|nr:putative endonuclease precursor with phospholipase D-like domain [Verrucomicrobiales bacterium]